jgi:hypothetical protein
VNPKHAINSERVVLSDWELHDMAVHSVIAGLKGKRLLSFSNDPDISPSVWYEGESGMEWVIVRWTHYPATFSPLPVNWPQIVESAELRGTGNGYFAVATIAAKDPSTGIPLANAPLFRLDDLFIDSLPMRQFVMEQSLPLAVQI